ncbi:type III secretion effector protein [Pseudomonas poae]|uniref:Type III secretion effector protein n=1 Tax=Pseudomonas poae TaxID=200451 RepID=A0A2S9EHK8_9PSED|nr:type III secretion effector protein [Pseudomonas poae]PRA25974.1 type III secretion effector protein [Pseudomonas poae]PRC14660.1 type III secretion effector protein [Pseudomonas poae]
MRDRIILVVREILKRPLLNDAIIDFEGFITRDSLKAAALALRGNSSPNTFSQDPFHGQCNAKVVMALQGYFKQLKDASKDRTRFFEALEYVDIALLKTVMNDPDELDARGLPQLEPATGLPSKKYSEHCVYMAKNIIERPGLLRSLERVNNMRLFGRPRHEGWLSNKSLERWLEQYNQYKAR